VDRRTDPIVGWRAWRVAATGDCLRLRSAVYDDVWTPGVELGATCPHRAHAAPDESCTCGIYAARDPAGAVRYLVGRDDPDVVHRVVGLVRLTGIVVEGRRGWRAQVAYPVRLWVPAADTNGTPAPAAEVVAGLGGYGARVDLVPAYAPAALATAVDEASHSLRGGPSPPRRESHTRMTRRNTARSGQRPRATGEGTGR
jgi:hypothetical protein